MLTVRTVMTRNVISATPSTPLKDVAQLMVDRRISGLPVVDDEGHVLGVVSEADFLVKEQGTDAVHHRRLARFFGEAAETRDQLAKLGAVTAGEAMSSPAVVASPSTGISEAAAVMTTRRLNRLPVVENDRLVGIVTRADLVRAYVRSDSELTTTVREDVLRRIMWVDPAAFTVIVQDGVVAISGRVERRSTAEAIERSIAFVPGVVGVHAAIGWELDDARLEPASIDPVFPFGPR